MNLSIILILYIISTSTTVFPRRLRKVSKREQEALDKQHRNAICCEKNMRCCVRPQKPPIEIRAVLARCPNAKTEKDSSITRFFAKPVIQANEHSLKSFQGFDEDEPLAQSRVTQCRRKVLMTLKMHHSGAVNTKVQYIVIDHVFDPLTEKSVRLLNPYVIKLRQEQVSKSFYLKFVDYVNSEAYEKIYNKHDSNYTGCYADKSRSTCGVVKYDGKIIPFSQGFCCSCDAAKNAERQPDSVNAKNEAIISLSDPAYLLDRVQCPRSRLKEENPTPPPTTHKAGETACVTKAGESCENTSSPKRWSYTMYSRKEEISTPSTPCSHKYLKSGMKRKRHDSDGEIAMKSKLKPGEKELSSKDLVHNQQVDSETKNIADGEEYELKDSSGRILKIKEINMASKGFDVNNLHAESSIKEETDGLKPDVNNERYNLIQDTKPFEKEPEAIQQSALESKVLELESHIKNPNLEVNDDKGILSKMAESVLKLKDADMESGKEIELNPGEAINDDNFESPENKHDDKSGIDKDASKSESRMKEENNGNRESDNNLNTKPESNEGKLVEAFKSNNKDESGRIKSSLSDDSRINKDNYLHSDARINKDSDLNEDADVIDVAATNNDNYLHEESGVFKVSKKGVLNDGESNLLQDSESKFKILDSDEYKEVLQNNNRIEDDDRLNESEDYGDVDRGNPEMNGNSEQNDLERSYRNEMDGTDNIKYTNSINSDENPDSINESADDMNIKVIYHQDNQSSPKRKSTESGLKDKYEELRNKEAFNEDSGEYGLKSKYEKSHFKRQNGISLKNHVGLKEKYEESSLNSLKRNSQDYQTTRKSNEPSLKSKYESYNKRDSNLKDKMSEMSTKIRRDLNLISDNNGTKSRNEEVMLGLKREKDVASLTNVYDFTPSFQDNNSSKNIGVHKVNEAIILGKENKDEELVSTTQKHIVKNQPKIAIKSKNNALNKQNDIKGNHEKISKNKEDLLKSNNAKSKYSEGKHKESNLKDKKENDKINVNKQKESNLKNMLAKHEESNYKKDTQHEDKHLKSNADEHKNIKSNVMDSEKIDSDNAEIKSKRDQEPPSRLEEYYKKIQLNTRKKNHKSYIEDVKKAHQSSDAYINQIKEIFGEDDIFTQRLIRKIRQTFPSGIQKRGRQNCADRYTPPGFDPEHYHESAHCLRFSDVWYGIYKLGDPFVEQSIYLNIYERFESERNPDKWREITNQTLHLGNRNPMYEDEMPTISIALSTESTNETSDEYSSLHSKRILIPEGIKHCDMQKYAEMRNGAEEYLVVNPEQIALEGDQCDRIGVGFEAFFKQPLRCGVPRSTCLHNQPKHLWRHDKALDKKGERGCYFLKYHANITKEPILINYTTGEKYLDVEYRGEHTTVVDIEIKADFNAIIRQTTRAVISEVYVDSTCEKITTIMVKVINSGLISNRFLIQLSDFPLDIPREFSRIKSKLTLISPQNQHIFTLEVRHILPSELLFCSIEVLNCNHELVALRRIRIQKYDRCICTWHCLCACVASSVGLKCNPMSLEHYHAAGFQGSLPIVTYMVHFTLLDDLISVVFYFALFLLVVLLMMGLCKALLGRCFPFIGLWGLTVLLDLPKRMKRYYEPELHKDSVIYDQDGWPIHPQTKKRVRNISRSTQFCTNLVFFFIYPLAGCLLIFRRLCCSYYTKKRKAQPPGNKKKDKSESDMSKSYKSTTPQSEGVSKSDNSSSAPSKFKKGPTTVARITVDTIGTKKKKSCCGICKKKTASGQKVCDCNMKQFVYSDSDDKFLSSITMDTTSTAKTPKKYKDSKSSRSQSHSQSASKSLKSPSSSCSCRSSRSSSSHRLFSSRPSKSSRKSSTLTTTTLSEKKRKKTAFALPLEEGKRKRSPKCKEPKRPKSM